MTNAATKAILKIDRAITAAFDCAAYVIMSARCRYKLWRMERRRNKMRYLGGSL